MRITGGAFRGRTLRAPEGLNVRPTTDKNRLAIFNILQNYGLPADAHVIDVFCGTGALGLEALSRGAAFCTFVDRDRTSIAFTKENIEKLKIGAQAAVLHREAAKIGPRPANTAPAELAFIDPPYRQNLTAGSLAALAGNGWLAPSAIAVLESETTVPDGELSDLPFDLVDTRLYGDTMIRMVRYRAESGTPSPE